ncbi:diacylglycerol kinase [Campylobacter sp. faydin G-105]|uniref:diacylglycerol kinase n=1 Tax=Campylobacter anatolicus TaxID=2829105 RepID=UPI001B922E13|nr:diacylglycerol kinase [Campylobacter anatolicus]MBR8461287.1 diacylglycerol kinase [Campylobacter anatolicus]
MRNQPKYNFFKNTRYALDGLAEIYKNENSFKIELCLIAMLIAVSFALPFEAFMRLSTIVSLLFVLFAECINSAIERVVDLVTSEICPLAKVAKDAGSAAVFISISIAVLTWLFAIWSIF